MNETFTPQDDKFLTEAKRVLDRSVQILDPDKTKGLQRARIHAFEKGMRRRSVAAWTWVSGLAVASVAIVALVFLLNRQEASNQHHPMLEDLELMTSTENVELSEDLEFYDWLVESTASTG
jgi:hypothetical protein